LAQAARARVLLARLAQAVMAAVLHSQLLPLPVVVAVPLITTEQELLRKPVDQVVAGRMAPRLQIPAVREILLMFLRLKETKVAMLPVAAVVAAVAAQARQGWTQAPMREAMQEMEPPLASLAPL
jgi:hypothetical protein